MIKSRYISLLFILLLPWLSYADDDRPLYKRINFNEVEVPFYSFAEYTPQVAFYMDYAQFELRNTETWSEVAAESIPYEIDLVFTKYPEDIQDWRTNYYQLLEDRIRTLYQIDPAFRSSRIRWNMILQTQCTNEEEAKRYFHGFVVKYRPKAVKRIGDIRSPDELAELVNGLAVTRDSSVIRILERNPEWDNMLVVMDWTGSMYKYGVQLVLWHKYNLMLSPSRVSHFVFFNDGNGKKTFQKKVGRTGGVYRSRSSDMEEIVETMQMVMKKGDGGDAAENDLEAILTGIQYLEGYEEVILIADNKSAIRDIELLEKIDKPIRIILCDVRNNVINPDYLKLAAMTNGSVHTIGKDIGRMARMQEGKAVVIGGMRYVMNSKGEVLRIKQ